MVQEIAEATGGTTSDKESTRGKNNLKAVLLQIYDQIAYFYQLEVELPTPVHKKTGWKIEVVDERGRKQKTVDTIYPRELLPCEAQPAQR